VGDTCVVTMYVDTSTVKTSSGKLHTRHLLRESFREGGKVKHRTIANLSNCSAQELAAIKLALWQLLARVIDQGSRLSAVRLASSHAACDVIGLGKFDEDDLYKNLDWLAANQDRIEDALYVTQTKQEGCGRVFLYDVTSSYLEGAHNALAKFGYNRDKKSGKRQIVIGLLCNAWGRPLSIQVFPGNTSDPKTVAAQIQKVKERFGATSVTFVGDRGMLKSEQISDLSAQGFHYITAITKPQIDKLLSENILQMSLFDQFLAEVVPDDGPRYILRRNPIRAAEIAQSREERLSALRAKVETQNDYLAAHVRASATKALTAMEARCKKLGLADWCTLALDERRIVLGIDPAAKEEAAKLDGCYVLKTDLPVADASKEIVHDRYKDLALVERAFRCSKTVHLEMRPIYLRLAERTRAHALIVMLAYKIIQHLAESWRELDLTVEEGLDKLSSLCLVEVVAKNTTAYNQVPTPRQDVADLLAAAKIKMPKALTASGIKVSTKKKLQSER